MTEERLSDIVFVHLLNDFSGSPNVLSQVVEVASKSSVIGNVEVYVGSEGKGFLSSPVKNTTYIYKRSRFKILTLIFYFISQFVLIFKLFKYRNKNVCIYVNTLLPFGAGIAGYLMRKKVIYHIHETSLKPRLLKLFLRFVVKLTASKVIFVSHYLREEEGFENIDQAVIHNALDSMFLAKASDSIYAYDDEDFEVLMACSLKEYKGVTEFIKIAQMCLRVVSIRFTLVLNATPKEIKEYLRISEIPKNVTIFPQQSDMAKFYSSASLVLNLSKPDGWIETFGLTILEAMAFGIPVIVPTVGGPLEIVRDNKDGYLMSSDQWPLIGEKIVDLSSNRDLCSRLSLSARQRAGEFGQPVFKRKIEVLIAE